MPSQSERVQALLAAPDSSHRRELVALVVDALLEREIASYLDRDRLRDDVLAALTEENAARVASRHVLPALERVAATLSGRPESVRDLLSPRGAEQLRAIVRSGAGPRYGFLRGALDGDDLRELFAPVVQQLLFAFTARLPIPGLGAAGAGGGGLGGSLGGLVGRIGKQVQRSAGQLADVGRSMFGGVIRDFSETATSEFRAALKERLKSPEGERIVARMRERFVEHVLTVRLDDVVRDAMYLPRPEIAALVATALGHQPTLPLFRELLEGELEASLTALAEQSAASLLREYGLYETVREQAIARVDAAFVPLCGGSEFGAWLARLLEAAGAP